MPNCSSRCAWGCLRSGQFVPETAPTPAAIGMRINAPSVAPSEATVRSTHRTRNAAANARLLLTACLAAPPVALAAWKEWVVTSDPDVEDAANMELGAHAATRFVDSGVDG